MVGLKEHTFNDYLSIAAIAIIEGVTASFLHINQHLANKKAISFPKAQIDVIELEKIKALREDLGLE